MTAILMPGMSFCSLVMVSFSVRRTSPRQAYIEPVVSKLNAISTGPPGGDKEDGAPFLPVATLVLAALALLQSSSSSELEELSSTAGIHKLKF